MTNKKYFTRKEMLEDLREALTDFALDYYDDIIHETFNTVYYTDGRKESEEALEQYGVFDAIGEVQQYEKDSFGEIYTNLSDPKAIATTLYYILGEETLYSYYPELSDVYYSLWDCEVNEENNQKMLAVIDKLIDELE